MRKKIRLFVLLSFSLYVLALAGLYVFQRSFIYFPNDSYLPPEDGKFQEFQVTTEDGIALKGWFSPAKPSRKTLVFFHGNADSVRKISFVAEAYRREGYGFLIVEYRGFSGFAGKPTEDGFYADARAFVKKLVEKGVLQKDIVLFGHSLGTGVASQMAFEFPECGGLMLLAPFLSVPDMAQMRFPFFPARHIVWDRFANNEKLPHLHMPVLIVHGTWDIVVPFSQGEALFALARSPKEFHAVPEGGHNNLFAHPFADISLSWLERLKPRP